MIGGLLLIFKTLKQILHSVKKFVVNRKLRIALFALIGLLLLLVPLFRAQRQSAPSALQKDFQSVVNDPVEFAKDHFTGGVGVILVFDQTNNLPRVNGVIRESPADRAGLRKGDLILQIDSVSTSNRFLAQIVDDMRGFTAKSVKLLILRGSTNVECTIHRASWNSLKKNMK